MAEEMAEAYLVQSHEQAMVLLNPLRGEILSRMTRPISAAEVAREMGDAPQRINYHLKALEKVGLVRRMGTRQVKNLVEVLYQAVARSFILSDSLGLQSDSLKQLQDQGALSHLVAVSDRIKRDVLRLMEASEQGEPAPSLSTHTKVRLAGEAERAEFVKEYMELLGRLVDKYQAGVAEEEEDLVGKDSLEPVSYEVLFAVYPTPPKGGSQA